MNITKYEGMVIRKRKLFPKNLDTSALSDNFKSAYNTGERIKVKFYYGDIKSGTVGVTTGHKPVFLLMLRKNSTGSSYTLSSKDVIIK